METKLLNCPFCNGVMEPFGPAQHNHPRNECWLSSVRVEAKEYQQWNRRAAPAQQAVDLSSLERYDPYLERGCDTGASIIMEQDNKGEWVRFENVSALLAAQKGDMTHGHE